MIVEVCANSIESAINAQSAGADRIELCAELAVGGLTPSSGFLKLVKEYISIPVNVLIRPRSGDFSYSDYEFQIMKNDIQRCVDMGFNGVVAGVLQRDCTLDVVRTQELVDLAKPLEFTFHRAFDWVADPWETLVQLESMGVQTILSSGQQPSSLKGIDTLMQLQEQAANCTIMPGGGVRPNNVNNFKSKGFKAIHLSGVQFQKNLEVVPVIPMSSPGFLKDDEILISNLDILKEVVRIVKE